MDVEQLKKGIFSLPFRRFGSFSQIMIKKLYGLSLGRNNFHDLYCDETQQRIEVKFSAVRSSWEDTLHEGNVLDCLTKTDGDRAVSFENWKNTRFDCNMNQVKRNEFELLYYGLFFWDQILVFKIKADEIGPGIYYSDKQHKGNVGEGQFHINNKTLPIHLGNYLDKKLDYFTLLDLLRNT